VPPVVHVLSLVHARQPEVVLMVAVATNAQVQESGEV
jgi:hypothetical protein